MKRIQPTRRPWSGSSSDNNPLGSLGGKKKNKQNSSIINILNVKSCYAWDTRTVRHAHTHFKTFWHTRGCLDIVGFVLLFRLFAWGVGGHIISHNWLNYDYQLNINSAELLVLDAAAQICITQRSLKRHGLFSFCMSVRFAVRPSVRRSGEQ